MMYDEETERYIEHLWFRIYELERKNAELKKSLDYYESMQLPILEIKNGKRL